MYELVSTLFLPMLAGHATDNPSLPLQLATASFDCKVKLWDPLKGKELFVLDEHAEPVYTVGFCPDGTLLATGSYDRTVKIWSAKTGKIVATFRGEGGVFEVSWDKVYIKERNIDLGGPRQELIVFMHTFSFSPHRLDLPSFSFLGWAAYRTEIVSLLLQRTVRYQYLT